MHALTNNKRWVWGILLLGMLFTLLVPYGDGSEALAHGKEVRVEVSSFTPDPDESLTRLYRVYVVYAGDLDAVTDATVHFTAQRQGGGPPVEPILLQPLNEAGVYASEVIFPLYGSWDVTLSVAEFGEGETRFVEDVVPLGPTVDTDEVRQQVLELFFRFGWRDVAAIVVRVAHSLSSITLFGLTGVVLVAYAFVQPRSRAHLFQKLSRVFLPAAIASIALLAVSGLYTAIFSAPIKPPGVFDFDVMRQIPFGPAYLATIAFKPLALTALTFLAFRMAKALRTASIPVPMGGSVATISNDTDSLASIEAALQTTPLLRLAVTNAVIGVLLAIDVVLAVYIHYISHLAVFLPN